MEVHGLVTLRVTDEKYGRIKIAVNNRDQRGIQVQTHPNVDKKRFASESCIALKNPDKSFPMKTDVGVLKWRFQTQDESCMPLSINCWPSETSSGCDVNIEYTLEQEDMELNDVVITIPLPHGQSPVVSDCDGEYNFDRAKTQLEWSIPVIDSGNKTGSMEFSIGGHPDDFFPVHVSFVSKKSFCDIELIDVQMVDDGTPVKFSSQVLFFVDNYEIV
ncbi:coatomer subunit delta-like [Lingula anatina]|nr:coatomer subunit delta-like [Lingula anatina]|eukprot:XP_013388796.2 coatomer subunit delta-like [Lingula anatina]